MAALPKLGYRSPQQLFAERSHMSEALLTALNPGNTPEPGEPTAVRRAGIGAEIFADARPGSR